MKLDEKDNIRLMKECCIVREMECTQQRRTAVADEFLALREVMKDSKDLSFDILHKEFDDIPPIKNFLKEMEEKSKIKINFKFYRKAVKCAERHASENKLGKLTADIKRQFFSEHRIQNLNVRFRRSVAKYVGVPVATLLATGTLYGVYVSHASRNLEEIQTEMTAREPKNESEILQEPNTRTAHLDVHDVNFASKMRNNFQELFVQRYNEVNPEALLTSNNFQINFSEHQNFIYKIKVGEEERYVSHGDYPAMIENYLKEHDVQAEPIHNCRAVSVYAIDTEGNVEKSYDEFGNFTKKKLDSAVQVNGEYVKLYDGNNPQDLLEPESKNPSILTEMGEIVSVFSIPTNTENDKNIVKEKYLSAIEKYQNKEEISSDSIEAKNFEDEGR